MSDRPNFPAQRWQPLDNENIYDQINSNKRASTSVIITKVSYVAQRHFLEHRVHLKAVFFTLCPAIKKLARMILLVVILQLLTSKFSEASAEGENNF